MITIAAEHFALTPAIREQDDNLYKAVETARQHLTRKNVEEKHRYIHERRKTPHFEAAMTSEELEGG